MKSLENNIWTCSIVLYNTAIDQVQNLLSSFRWTPYLKIYIVDNSPSNKLSSTLNDCTQIEYVHNPSNPGFGASHNIAIRKAIGSGSNYHFIINPDIHFDEDVIAPMIEYMQRNSDVGMMMPKVLNEDGTIQYLPKLLPNPLWIFRRKLKKIDPFWVEFINKYELRNAPENEIYDVPILSGCFTLLNLNAVREVGMYDDDFFMYFEDFDLSRRMHQKYRTVYFPKVSVYHGYEGGANKNFKLFKIFLKSMFTYFNKWGWFFDKERTKINCKTLKQFID